MINLRGKIVSVMDCQAFRERQVALNKQNRFWWWNIPENSPD